MGRQDTRADAYHGPISVPTAHPPASPGLRRHTGLSSNRCTSARVCLEEMNSVTNKVVCDQSFAEAKDRGEMAGGEALADSRRVEMNTKQCV